ncbi:hypothetical protein FNS29_00910, partial [Xylella fastidiosa subsp. fastidiosa]
RQRQRQRQRQRCDHRCVFPLIGIVTALLALQGVGGGDFSLIRCFIEIVQVGQPMCCAVLCCARVSA